MSLNGLLVVDKPGREEILSQGQTWLPTSHDIVNRVRRWSGEQRIGHTGTLDPMASGVLVLTIGNATKLTEYLQGHDKRYEAEITLGYATDSYDITGNVTQQSPIPELDVSKIEAALARFGGEIQQKPPAFSAIKQAGVTAYKRARKGKEISLEPRTITFHQLTLVEWVAPDRIRLDVHCSAGAYIRSLAYDLGEALGTLGVLSRLRRTAVADFTIAQAYSLTQVEAAAQQGALEGLLLPARQGLTMPAIWLDAETQRKLGFGQTVNLPNTALAFRMEDAAKSDRKEVEAEKNVGSSSLYASLIAQAVDSKGQLVGLLRCLAPLANARAIWRADKWFQTHADHHQSSDQHATGG